MRERIILIIDKLGLTQKKFAEQVGITAGGLTDFIKGRSKDLSSSTVTNIVLQFGINPTWLLTGKGEIFTTSPSDPISTSSAHRLSREGEGKEMQPEAVNKAEVEYRNNGFKTIKGGVKSPAPEDVTRENIHLTKLFNSLSKKKQIAFLLLLEIQDEKFFEEAIGYLSYKLDHEKKAKEGEKEIISQKGEAG